MSGFDREMQDALMADAAKLRAMGVDCPDPIFFDGEPEMAICGWCEYAHESEDVLTLRSGERVCISCLDAKYGPRRDNRWPL